jgi:ribosome biogenesis GTPase
MNSLDDERLRSMGLTPALARQAQRLADGSPVAGLRPMRLTEVHRESVRLDDGGHEHHALPAPRLSRELAAVAGALTVGDWVLAAPDTDGPCRIHHLVPPRTRLVRRDAHGRRHPVASNVDTALLVMGLDDDFNLGRLERFVALVQGTGVRPVIVLTKADAVADARSLYARQQAARHRIAAPLELLSVDARDADTARRLAPLAGAGQTLVLLGSSGAGKSTLTNTLLEDERQDTGAVREHDSRGKHTTTARSLFRLPAGGSVIDTPGLRALRPDADAPTVAASFRDIELLAARCRYRDCSHQGEPGCGVRPVVDEDRLRNYHKLLAEARRDVLGAPGRQQQLALWKERGREGALRLRIKRGEA